jgi:hypothetical protein
MNTSEATMDTTNESFIYDSSVPLRTYDSAAIRTKMTYDAVPGAGDATADGSFHYDRSHSISTSFDFPQKPKVTNEAGPVADAPMIIDFPAQKVN